MSRRWLSLVLLAACGEASFNSGDIGVTPGGSQDITYARELIEAGRVPDQEHYTAEGLFSEHDLPLDGPDCREVLCPRTQATIHRPFAGAPKTLVQLGFGTSVTKETFVRPDLDLVFLVDVSGSMSGEPLELSKEAMLAAVDHLGPNDRAGLVEYGSSAKVVERSRPMDERNKEKLRAAIGGLASNGSTDMESGMQAAYREIDLDAALSRRLMIFSDAQPNTGLTEESDFLRLVREKAADDVGLTFIGVSPQVGSELADVISKVRGGNFHFLTKEKVEELFVDGFDFLVSPVAYDLEAEMVGLEGATLSDEVYGAPVDGDAVKLGASTLFFSNQNGGMAATFDVVPTGPITLGMLAVSWLPIGASERVSASNLVTWRGGDFAGEADGLGVAKIDGLVHQYKAMRAASEACDAVIAFADAAAQVDAAAASLTASAGDLAQPDLETEADLLEQLAANLRLATVDCAPADIWNY